MQFSLSKSLACVCCVKISRNKRKRQPIGVATMIGCLPTQALAFLAVFVYATHATQEIAFEWKQGFRICSYSYKGRTAYP